jgi:tetratricopeptide (TPR) repeat protein
VSVEPTSLSLNTSVERILVQTPTPPMSQALAQKERRLFADLLHAYEQKHLPRARKLADQILRKHPLHGETMCMKGLVLVHLGERDPGIALIKDGMRRDLASHICWHVWALVQKGEHNYDEALKSYSMALKIDKVPPRPPPLPRSLAHRTTSTSSARPPSSRPTPASTTPSSTRASTCCACAPTRASSGSASHSRTSSPATPQRHAATWTTWRISYGYASVVVVSHL